MKSQFKNVASQSFKVLLCLVMLFMFVFVTPKQKMQEAEAAIPIVAWAVTVLGSLVLDVAIDMGIEFVDDVAKTKWKDKKVGEIWNKYGEEIKKLKPTKKNIGKWIVSIPKWLKAVAVDVVTDSIEDTVQKDTKRKETNKKPIQNKIDYDNVDPFYNTGVSLEIAPEDNTASADLKAYAYLTEYAEFTLTPIAYEQESELKVCVADSCWSEKLDGGGNYTILTTYYDYYKGIDFKLVKSTSSSKEYVQKFKNGIQAFEKALDILEEKNKKVYQADGVIVTDGYDGYFDLPDQDDDGKQIVYSPDVINQLDESKYPMIKDTELEFDFGDDSGVIDADFEVINEGDEVSWEIIEKDITNNSSNYNKVINYDYEPTINNYYEVSSKEDLENDINVIVQNEVTVNNGGSGGNGGSWSGEIEIEGPYYCIDKESKLPTSCKEVEAIDGSLLDYVKNAYDYGVNAVKSGVDGLNTILAGATGLITLYSNIFDWLPDEVTIILTSGLLLMIGLRVFRK